MNLILVLFVKISTTKYQQPKLSLAGTALSKSGIEAFSSRLPANLQMSHHMEAPGNQKLIF